MRLLQVRFRMWVRDWISLCQYSPRKLGSQSSRSPWLLREQNPGGRVDAGAQESKSKQHYSCRDLFFKPCDRAGIASRDWRKDLSLSGISGHFVETMWEDPRNILQTSWDTTTGIHWWLLCFHNSERSALSSTMCLKTGCFTSVSPLPSPEEAIKQLPHRIP